MPDTLLSMLLSIAATLTLILINGVFVAAEFAIVRVRRTRLEELVGEGKQAAKHAILLVDRVTEYLAVTQIGVTAASLGAGWFGEESFARLLLLVLSANGIPSATLHIAAAVLAFLLITTLHVVVGELIPKNLAISEAERLLLILARPLQILHALLRPLHWFFENLANWILRRFGHEAVPQAPLTEDELKLVLTHSHEQGVLSPGEAKIMMRAFEFADKQASEILIAPEHVDFISLARSIDENLDVAQLHMHARLPLCRTGLDSVLGVVSMKDVWPLVLADKSNTAFERVARAPITITVDLSQDGILQRLQEGRSQMGIVRDRSGTKTLGIVTLEDVLEALVGDVREAPSGTPRAC